MTISFEDAILAQKNIEETLLKNSNVVSVGVVAEVNSAGIKTGSYVIKVGVIALEGKSIIPDKYKIHSLNSPSAEQHVKIHVVQSGEIKALTISGNVFSKRYPAVMKSFPSLYANSHKKSTGPLSRRTSFFTTLGIFGAHRLLNFLNLTQKYPANNKSNFLQKTP